jgi:DNA polymerase
MTDRDQQILAALLDWTLAMGAESAVAAEAIDWLGEGRGPPGGDFDWGQVKAETALAPQAGGVAPRTTSATAERSLRPPQVARANPPQGTSSAGVRKFASAAPDVATGAARAAARNAATLEDLERALKAFEGCGLKATAKSLCFYRGAAQAPLAIIGEAPGREEDIEGRPFVGRAGQLLDRILAAIGWNEDDVHITNIVYWRPPGNRPPTPQETEVCRPFLERQIELVAPRAVLLLGGAAAKQIFRRDEGILNARGRWQTVEFGALSVPTMATLHPAYLLRTPIAKKQAWLDLLRVAEALRSAPA